MLLGFFVCLLYWLLRCQSNWLLPALCSRVAPYDAQWTCWCQNSSLQHAKICSIFWTLSLFRPVLILISLIWKSKLLTFFLLLKLNAKQFYNYRHRNGKMVSFFKVRNNSNYISHTPFSRFYLQLLSSVSLKTASAISAYYSSSLLTSAWYKSEVDFINKIGVLL